MTNEELLQQAKDQVAKAWIKENNGFTYTGDAPWEYFVRAAHYDQFIHAGFEKAALQAIQRAREEAVKALESFSNPHYDKGVPGCTYGDGDYDSMAVVHGYNTALREVASEANAALEKLTAPGR